MQNVESHEKIFDFDHWHQLAKTNPQAFEEKRLAMIESVIATAPRDMQQRLRGLQWRIDMERERSKNPLNACVNLYRMMWNKVYGQDGLLEALDNLLHFNSETAQETVHVRDAKKEHSAAILHFRMGN